MYDLYFIFTIVPTVYESILYFKLSERPRSRDMKIKRIIKRNEYDTVIILFK